MPDPEISLRQLIEGAVTVLDEAGVPSPRVDAISLAEHVLGVDRLVLAMAPQLPADFAPRFAEVVERRRRREPLQHITGWAPFRHLRLRTRAGVFVPRPETEVVAEPAIDAARELVRAGHSPLVVDLCCGAGAIALSLAQEAPGVVVIALDASPPALELTRANAAEHGLAVRTVLADVGDDQALAEFNGQVDVVVANPPYIPPEAVPKEVEVRDYDPDIALYGGGVDGLQIPRAVLTAATRLLRPGGLLVMEHAEVQADVLRAEVQAGGLFTAVHTEFDLNGRARMVLGNRAGASVADSSS